MRPAESLTHYTQDSDDDDDGDRKTCVVIMISHTIAATRAPQLALTQPHTLARKAIASSASSFVDVVVIVNCSPIAKAATAPHTHALAARTNYFIRIIQIYARPVADAYA